MATTALVLSLVAATALAQQAATPTASSYAPVYVACPSGTPLVRLAGTAAGNNQTLSSGEQAYLRGRAQAAAPLWESFLANNAAGKGTGYDAASLSANNNIWPVSGLAHSGGGFRASLYGASVAQAMDSRNTTSALAGFLQLFTYQTGLSGGSWFLSSLVLNGYPTVPDLITGSSPGWELSKDVFVPDGVLGVSDNNAYIDALQAQAQERAEAGFNTSITDVWGRALAYHLLPGTTSSNFFDSNNTGHGIGILFSQITTLSIYANFSVPFPILVADNAPPGGQMSTTSLTVIPLNTTVYEISPLELGSYDPYLAAFTPTGLLGTYAEAGNAFVPGFINRTNSTAGDCVNSFDQASFVFGTSSSLFNAITAEANVSISSGVSSAVGAIIADLSGASAARGNDVEVANYPNPFQGVNGPAGFDRSGSVGLELVDGGENGENVPLAPLLVKARGLDVIIAADASADTSEGDTPNGANWPNGTSLVTTYNRTFGVLPQGAQEFPQVPVQQTVWVNNGLNRRPTFFGCNESAPVPLVVYLPNTPNLASGGYTTNTSTLKLDYSDADTQSFLDSGSSSTNGGYLVNGAADPQWPTCLACVMLDRTRARNQVARSSACTDCFNRYCWNGTEASGGIGPDGRLPESAGGRVDVGLASVVGAVAVAVAVVAMA